MNTTTQFAPPSQSPETLNKIQKMLAELNGWELAALDVLTTVTKSFITSYCLLFNHPNKINIEKAWESARLEENYQMNKWGKVEGIYGHGVDMEYVRMSLAAAKTFINFLRLEHRK
jgi:ATP synthase F1 complex assembly factor 2